MKKKLWLFDFDGTITSADTLLCFIRHACGWRRFAAGFLHFSPLLVLMKLHLYPNWRAKERLFAWFFGGMSEADFNSACSDFAARNGKLLRPAAATLLGWLLESGEQVCIVSASIDNWVRPFFNGIAPQAKLRPTIIGTQVEVADGRITGHFLTPNCYGAEKVKRVQALFPNRNDYEITAFGDSRGDKEMLSYADERHYKPFR